ncbi:MAG: tetraprenyl-beta-curcumene synthase family protein [Bacillota bacterium]
MSDTARIPWLYNYLRGMIPGVQSELARLTERANLIEDRELRLQALNSLKSKAFHCYGGSVLALLGPRNRWQDLMALITAFQTISDYLDNLCDRVGICNQRAFYRLHDSMLTAATPGAMSGDYYDLYDGYREEGYLPFLVARCQGIISSLPGLEHVHDLVRQLIQHYTSLQSLKHMSPDQRCSRVEDYIRNQVENPPGFEWWEMAAATGSTLGMFALWAMAAHPDCDSYQANKVYETYFPWICGLHILLDYLIDQEEDMREGDMNFVSFYPRPEARWEALYTFTQKSLERAASLPPAGLHTLVVTGLLAMYLSDAKVKAQGYSGAARRLIQATGKGNLALYHLCRAVRCLKGI